MSITSFVSRSLALVGALALAATANRAAAIEPSWQSGEAIAVAITGQAEVSNNGKDWRVLREYEAIKPGSEIRTKAASKVELYMNHNGPAVVVESSSHLALSTLKRLQTGDEIDTNTELDVKAGSIVGYTQKMSSRSRYVVNHQKGQAVITGTIYQVYASGFVYVSSGAVEVRYSLNGIGNLGNVVTVNTGFHFNPITYATSPGLPPLPPGDSLIATVNTTVGNIRKFNLSRGRKLEIKAVNAASD